MFLVYNFSWKAEINSVWYPLDDHVHIAAKHFIVQGNFAVVL